MIANPGCDAHMTPRCFFIFLAFLGRAVAKKSQAQLDEDLAHVAWTVSGPGNGDQTPFSTASELALEMKQSKWAEVVAAIDTISGAWTVYEDHDIALQGEVKYIIGPHANDINKLKRLAVAGNYTAFTVANSSLAIMKRFNHKLKEADLGPCEISDSCTLYIYNDHKNEQPPKDLPPCGFLGVLRVLRLMRMAFVAASNPSMRGLRITQLASYSFFGSSIAFIHVMLLAGIGITLLMARLLIRRRGHIGSGTSGSVRELRPPLLETSPVELDGVGDSGQAAG